MIGGLKFFPKVAYLGSMNSLLSGNVNSLFVMTMIISC